MTRLLRDLSHLEADNHERLLELVYDALHDLAARHLRRERRDHTLQPTALVHEAYLRLVGQDRVEWKGRAHFLSVASRAIRRILVDHARGRNRQKRGGDAIRVTMGDVSASEPGRDVDVLDLDRALEALEREDALDHSIVMLRFFAGLNVEETARALGIGVRTVERRWAFARAWLYGRLQPGAR